MDLQTLSTLDDLLSDVLLDGVSLWFQTHKMNTDYCPMRLPPGKILDIIQRRVIVDRKVPEAVRDLMEFEPIKNMIKTEKEIQDFTTHARRYFNIYLPTAGFEISQTDRYSAVTNKSEACVIANRPFEVGFELRYCAGTIANLNEQEERDLESRTSDFSVIKTSRRGTCLFLGPARFVNHDCDPNCSFMSAGANVIYFKVKKPISVNDEITTHYGDNYFGVGNQECLCATCERRGQGGYKKQKGAAAETPLSPTLKPIREGPTGRRLRNRGKNVNYYPTLLLRPAPKQTQTPPKRTLSPVESDTIPSTAGPPTPTSQRDSDVVEKAGHVQGSPFSESTPGDMPGDEPQSTPGVLTEEESDVTPRAMPEDELESTPGAIPEDTPDTEKDLEQTLADSMTLLRVTETQSRTLGQQQATYDGPGNTTVDHGEQGHLESEETIHLVSPKNFRMSIDFLCHNPARPTMGGTTSEGEARTDDDQDSTNDNAAAPRTKARSKKSAKGKGAAADATNDSGPTQCETCRDTIPDHETTASKDCRRCHRHFSIYDLAWPSRSNQAIVARLRKAEREEAQRLKAVQDALEAERLKKKKAAEKAAADAQRLAAKAEARARLEQLKADTKARTEANKAGKSEKARPAKKRAPKPATSQNLPGGTFDPRLCHYARGMSTASPSPVMYAGASAYGMPATFGSRAYPGQALRPYMHGYAQPTHPLYMASSPKHSRCDFSAIITEQHPFHYAPYVVFVDPQDGNDTSFWWMAVTIPRNQMDSTMPEIARRADDTLDPDLIVVRFLEDFKYSVCNISGLRLFHPDQEPYRGYVHTFGRNFIKNLGVKRALAFMQGAVPQGLEWRNLSCDRQLSLPAIAAVTRRIEEQIREEVLRVQELRLRPVHYQALGEQQQQEPQRHPYQHQHQHQHVLQHQSQHQNQVYAPYHQEVHGQNAGAVFQGHDYPDASHSDQQQELSYYAIQRQYQQQQEQQYAEQYRQQQLWQQEQQSLAAQQQHYYQQLRMQFGTDEEFQRCLAERESISMAQQHGEYPAGIPFGNHGPGQDGEYYGSEGLVEQPTPAVTTPMSAARKRQGQGRGPGKKTLARLQELGHAQALSVSAEVTDAEGRGLLLGRTAVGSINSSQESAGLEALVPKSKPRKRKPLAKDRVMDDAMHQDMEGSHPHQQMLSVGEASTPKPKSRRKNPKAKSSGDVERQDWNNANFLLEMMGVGETLTAKPKPKQRKDSSNAKASNNAQQQDGAPSTMPLMGSWDPNVLETKKPKVGSTVVWWPPAAYQSLCAATIKPRLANKLDGNFLLHDIVPDRVPPRFESLPTLYALQEESLPPLSAGDPFERAYRFLEWRILEGSHEGDRLDSQGGVNQGSSAHIMGEESLAGTPISMASTETDASLQGPQIWNPYGFEGGELADDDHNDSRGRRLVKSSETLSVPASSGSRESSSFPVSLACSVVGDEEQEIDVVGIAEEYALAGTRFAAVRRSSAGTSGPVVASKKFSRKRLASSTTSDISIGSDGSNVRAFTMEKSRASTKKRSKTRVSTLDTTSRESSSLAEALADMPPTTMVAQKPILISFTPGSRPSVPARTELERLQVWTIKDSLPRDGSGSTRVRSSTPRLLQQPKDKRHPPRTQSHHRQRRQLHDPKQQQRPPQPEQQAEQQSESDEPPEQPVLIRKVKTALERLQQWTIHDHPSKGKMSIKEVTTGQGRKRSRTPKASADETAIVPQYGKRSKRSNVQISSETDSSISSPTSTAQGAMAQSAEFSSVPSFDLKRSLEDSFSNAAISASDLAMTFAENKELQSLTRWTIKDSMIPIDLDSNVRSSRSRARVVKVADKRTGISSDYVSTARSPSTSLRVQSITPEVENLVAVIEASRSDRTRGRSLRRQDVVPDVMNGLSLATKSTEMIEEAPTHRKKLIQTTDFETEHFTLTLAPTESEGGEGLATTGEVSCPDKDNGTRKANVNDVVGDALGNVVASLIGSTLTVTIEEFIDDILEDTVEGSTVKEAPNEILGKTTEIEQQRSSASTTVHETQAANVAASDKSDFAILESVLESDLWSDSSHSKGSSSANAVVGSANSEESDGEMFIIVDDEEDKSEDVEVEIADFEAAASINYVKMAEDAPDVGEEGEHENYAKDEGEEEEEEHVTETRAVDSSVRDASTVKDSALESSIVDIETLVVEQRTTKESPVDITSLNDDVADNALPNAPLTSDELEIAASNWALRDGPAFVACAALIDTETQESLPSDDLQGRSRIKARQRKGPQVVATEADSGASTESEPEPWLKLEQPAVVAKARKGPRKKSQILEEMLMEAEALQEQVLLKDFSKAGNDYNNRDESLLASAKRRATRPRVIKVVEKQPNTTVPRFKMGEEVQAPAEEGKMFASVVRAIRDHETAQEMYEYKVHYHGYAQKYDAWVEERLLIASKSKSRR